MAKFFFCAYFDGQIEFAESREEHIRRRHPDFWPHLRELLPLVLSQPDEIRRRPWLPNEFLFVRLTGRAVDAAAAVVVVVEDEPTSDRSLPRRWVGPAYLTDIPPRSELLWSSG